MSRDKYPAKTIPIQYLLDQVDQLLHQTHPKEVNFSFLETYFQDRPCPSLDLVIRVLNRSSSEYLLLNLPAAVVSPLVNQKIRTEIAKLTKACLALAHESIGLTARAIFLENLKSEYHITNRFFQTIYNHIYPPYSSLSEKNVIEVVDMLIDYLTIASVLVDPEPIVRMFAHLIVIKTIEIRAQAYVQSATKLRDDILILGTALNHLEQTLSDTADSQLVWRLETLPLHIQHTIMQPPPIDKLFV